MKKRQSYESTSGNTLTLRFDEVPSWMQVDPLIRRGYRRELKTLVNCTYTLFYVHNEFVNCWSHLLPAIIHSILLIREALSTLSNKDGSAPRNDIYVVQLYVFSAIICLLSSATYHVLNAHSEHVAKKLLKLDYLGVVFNTTATLITSTWFGLREQPGLRNAYITSTIGLSALLFLLLLRPDADGSAAAVWRILLFVAFVGSGYIPIAQSYLSFGLRGLHYFPLRALITMKAFYSMGIFFYVSRFPESQFPEKFDIWGASHQLFHVLVMIGQIVYLRGLREAVAQI